MHLPSRMASDITACATSGQHLCSGLKENPGGGEGAESQTEIYIDMLR
jgi:hypothetical protein